MNAEEINARKVALKNTIEAMRKPIKPLEKELEELEKLSKNKNEKESK